MLDTSLNCKLIYSDTPVDLVLDPENSAIDVDKCQIDAGEGATQSFFIICRPDIQ